MAANLFVYGTLMCDDIFKAVSGHVAPRKKALLKDHRRFEVKNEAYPGMVALPGGEVEGYVWFDIPAASWRRLDRFEGEMYIRRSLKVVLEEGDVVDAEAYVVRDDFRHLLGERDWDRDAFMARGKEYFVNYYRGYDALEEPRCHQETDK